MIMKKLLFFVTLLTSMLNAQTVSDYVTVSGNPTGIVFDSKGILYVGTESDYGIKKFENNSLTTLKTGMNGQPRQLAIDSFGDIWASFQALGSIKSINSLTGTSVSYPAYSAYGMAIDPISKNIYFSEERDGVISVFDLNTIEITNLSHSIKGARGLVFDKNGNLYVASVKDNKVYKVTQNGILSIVITNAKNPSYLALDKDQNLYISTDYAGKIYKYNLSETTTEADLFVSDLEYTNGLAVYNDELYCALVSRNKVVKISLSDLSTAEISKNEMVIYPNPVKDFLNINIENNNLKIELYSMDGKLILTKENTKQVNVSSLSKGTYILKVITADKTFTQKISKN